MIEIAEDLNDAYTEIGNASVFWLPSDGSASVSGTGTLDATDVETHGDAAISGRYVLRVPAVTFDGLCTGESITITDSNPAALETDYRIVAPPRRINDGGEMVLLLEPI